MTAFRAFCTGSTSEVTRNLTLASKVFWCKAVYIALMLYRDSKQPRYIGAGGRCYLARGL